VRSELRGTGVDITRNINNTVKQTSKGIVTNVPGRVGDLAEPVTKVVTNSKKNEIKKITSR
jgi:hypothetical protein